MNEEQYKRACRAVILQMSKKEIMYVFRKRQELREMDEMDAKTRAITYFEKLSGRSLEAEIKYIVRRLKDLAIDYGADEDNLNLRRVCDYLSKIAIFDPFIYTELAIFYSYLEQEDKVREVYGKVIDIVLKADMLMAYGFGEIIDNYFFEKAAEGNFSEIVSICDELLLKDCSKLKPEQIKKVKIFLYGWLGEAYIRQSDYEAARAVLLEAYMMDPGDSDVKLSFAKYYTAVNDYKTSKKYAQEVIEKDCANDHAWFELGMANIFEGNREEGKKCLIAAYKIDPTNPPAKLNLLRCLYELGELKVLTNCDEVEFIEGLVESGEGDKIIDKYIADKYIDDVKAKLEDLFKL
jgi:tetratricopeptide (TPR) repeat protein